MFSAFLSIPAEQGAVMTSVLLTVALNGGKPLSHTMNGILTTEPTGKLELMLQFFNPTLENSCPVANIMRNAWGLFASDSLQLTLHYDCLYAGEAWLHYVI